MEQKYPCRLCINYSMYTWQEPCNECIFTDDGVELDIRDPVNCPFLKLKPGVEFDAAYLCDVIHNRSCEKQVCSVRTGCVDDCSRTCNRNHSIHYKNFSDEDMWKILCSSKFMKFVDGSILLFWEKDDKNEIS